MGLSLVTLPRAPEWGKNNRMAPLVWHWPDTLIAVIVTIGLALVTRLLVSVAINKTVAMATSRAEKHRNAKPTRASRLLAEATGVAVERTQQRAATMGSLLKSIATFIIALVAVLTIMAALGLPLAPVLASAGVGGIALGFGAQSLVKDFLSGIAVIVEDQYGVGDFIDTGMVSGTVEEVSLRVTRIRDSSGMVWYVRNGEIARVGNHSQGWSTAMVDIPVAYDEDPAQTKAVLAAMLDQLDDEDEWNSVLLEPPSVLGVESMGPGEMVMRIMVKTQPNQQWGVQREIRARAKTALASAGISAPVVISPTTSS